MLAYFKDKKEVVEMPVEQAASVRIGAELSDYLSKTTLHGVLTALPMSCRKMVMESEGVLFQLALIALIQSEKEQKRIHVLKHKGKKNKLVVQVLVKKIKAELGPLKKKIKRIKRKLKEEKKNKRYSLRYLGRKLLVRKKTKSPKKISKKGMLKNKRSKKASKLFRAIKIKVVKKQKVKTKMSAKRLAKLSKPKSSHSKKSVKKGISNIPKGAGKIASKKGKLSFLSKPKTKPKAAKKQAAKPKKQAKFKLSLLGKKRGPSKAMLAIEKNKKVKVANSSSFFKRKADSIKGSSKSKLSKNKTPIGQRIKQLEKSRQKRSDDIKHSA